MQTDEELADEAQAQKKAALATLSTAIDQVGGANHSSGDGAIKISAGGWATVLNYLVRADRLSPDALAHLASEGNRASGDPRALTRVFCEVLGLELGQHAEQLPKPDEYRKHLVAMKDGVAGAEASAENARTAHLEILSLRDEAKRAAEAARVSASEAAEIAYAKDLLREKTSHESEAFKIQVAIGGMFAIWIILCFGFGLSLPAAIDEYSPRWWIPMVGRAFILATIGGVIVWLMRLYRSERHNVIAYGQKLAALRTFESFVSVASRDDNAKAAIISHAMGTIFALHDTGYGAMSDAESAMPTEALVRAFSKVTEVAATKAATKVADAATPT